MTIEKAIEMIEEYLLEPNNINKEWVECLQMCKQALVENVSQKEKIKRLERLNCLRLDKIHNLKLDNINAKTEGMKEFAESMKKCIYQKNYRDGKILCGYTGSIMWGCPIRGCKYFHPTLRFRLFGKRR